jgi:murein DD-endopeptidase MepM/ murein hydrolase activator NlpD
MLGQRYAFDFMRTDRRPGQRYHPAGWLRTVLLGVPTRECYGWGAAVLAPFDGEVVAAVDGVAERERVFPLRELLLALKNAITFTPDRLPDILGNHVILRRGEIIAAFAHLAPGSVAVRPGASVAQGSPVGQVGHTGNSTAPHLHFQLMDGVDPLSAAGIPCAFEAYEVWRDATWVGVRDGVPGKADRIRAVPEASG